MKDSWFRSESRAINFDHVACIDRQLDGSLKLHYAVPSAEVVSGVAYEHGNVPPIGSDHLVQFIEGEDAAAIWEFICGPVNEPTTAMPFPLGR